VKFRLILLVVAAAVAVFPGSRDTAAEDSAVMADADSLEAMVRFLSIDPSTSLPRSRYAGREAELAEVADALAARLELYTGVTPVRQSFTDTIRIDDRDTTYTGENIICRVETAGESSGVLLVTAHFDAIARRSWPGSWDSDWVHSPAPGADDNATGVASVMEAARILSQVDLPFDLEFVLFSGEELGRVGSIHYVSLCDAGCADHHLGMINADMIGYSGHGPGASIMSDFRSGWLADMIIEYAAATDPTLGIGLIKPGPSNWDHASFWEREPERLPAVTLAEPLLPVTGSIVYPDYHTVDDLIENVDFDQTARIASLINGFIASFSGAPAENSMMESDLLILVNGAIRYENVFHAGEEISVMPRVRNTGGSVPPAGASVHLDVWLENASGRRRIFSGDLEPAEPLRYVAEEIDLGSGSGLGGGNVVTAEISVSGMDDDPSDNSASAVFQMEDTGEEAFSHHFSPNPVRSSFDQAMFCVNTTEEVNLNVEIYTIEGMRLGSAQIGSAYGTPVPVGFSCYYCGDIFPGIRELASGIYLYRVAVSDAGGGSNDYRGRFAVER
jgi:hypothetical protein